MTTERATMTDNSSDAIAGRIQMKFTPHEFVRRDTPDGGHQDRRCVECGLGDTNPVHRENKTGRS
jgi:hypothetical protein